METGIIEGENQQVIESVNAFTNLLKDYPEIYFQIEEVQL
jgi:hypothetical protein